MTPESLNLIARSAHGELAEQRRLQELRQARQALALRIEEIAKGYPSVDESSDWCQSAGLPLDTLVVDGARSRLYAIASCSKAIEGGVPRTARIEFFIEIDAILQHLPTAKRIVTHSGEQVTVAEIASEYLPNLYREGVEASLEESHSQIARLQETCNSFPVLRKDD